MLKKIIKTIFLFLILLNIPQLVGAICPVCTIGISAGVGLCRWLGIDDLISGVWIGGLIISLIIWLVSWFDKKNIKFKSRGLIISVFFYAAVFLPFYYLNIIGHEANKFLGIDKLLFGTAAGSFVFLLAVLFHNFLKKKNQGKAFFPYQKVVIPISFLIIISLIFYFLIRCQT